MEKIHHANLLIGSAQDGEKYLSELLKNIGFKPEKNPDFIAFREALFGIDESRKLSDFSSRKSLGDKKIFLITPTRLTTEAQNALLKIFEDPSSETYFFLVVREEALILPTLRSRMRTLKLSSGEDLELEEANKFLKLPLKDRLLFAKDFSDKEKKLPEFLDELMLLVRTSNAPKLEKVYNLRRFANDRSVAPRLILEHLALILD